MNGDATTEGKGATTLAAGSTRTWGRARVTDTVAGQLLLPIFSAVLAKTLHRALLFRVLKKHILFFNVTWAILWRSLLSLQMSEEPAWVSTQKLDMGKAKHALPRSDNCLAKG